MTSRNLIPLGRLTKPHGLRGELRMLPFNPDTAAIAPGTNVVLCRDEDEACHRIGAVRRHKNFLLITFEGCDSIESAQEMVGYEVCVERAQLPAPGPEEFYHHDLVGLRVSTTAGEELGHVVEVMALPSNDVCVVRGDGREYLIPFIADVVRTVDPAGGRLVIEPLPGLLDE